MILQSMTDVLLYHWDACIGSVSRVLSLSSTEVDNAMALTLNERSSMLLHLRIPAVPAHKRTF